MKIVLIAGGSASGKTTLARRLQGVLPDSQILSQDHFYICQSLRQREADGSLNFDVPDAIDFAAMAEALGALRAQKHATIPVYDFATHSRVGQSLMACGMSTLILEGTLVMSQPDICDLADIRLFVRAPQSLRQARRERRDTQERGRTLQSVRQQLADQVFPAHEQYIEPSAAHADLVLDAALLERDMNPSLHDLTRRIEQLDLTASNRAAMTTDGAGARP